MCEKQKHTHTHSTSPFNLFFFSFSLCSTATTALYQQDPDGHPEEDSQKPALNAADVGND